MSDSLDAVLNRRVHLLGSSPLHFMRHGGPVELLLKENPLGDSYWSYFIEGWKRFNGARQSDFTRLFIDTKWSHHVKRSGYHLLCDGIGYPLPCDMGISPASLRRFVSKLSINPDWESQALLRILLKRRQFKYLHINDGDFVRWPVRPRPGPDKLIVSATFHQPLDVLTRRVGLDRVGEIDIAVAVATCQLEYLSELFGERNVRFVPHGVDTDYFFPSGARDENLVISVGVHRRDFDTLRAAAKTIVASRPETKVVLVGPSRHLPASICDSALTVLRDMEDEEVRNLYRRASCQLLPLVAGTANNAILEGMASGLPLVTTDLPGIADYIADDWCFKCPQGDSQAHAEATLSILSDSSLQSEMSGAARKCSLPFDWRVVRDQFVQAFDNTI